MQRSAEIGFADLTKRHLSKAFASLEVEMNNRMEVMAQYLGDSKFVVAARGHRVICDQPFNNGGSDEGMSPPEFLLASLAACAAYYAAEYLKTRGLPAEDLAVRVTAKKALKPARLASFRIEVTGPVLEERHQAGILRAVKACLIHNTLLGEPNIEMAVNTAACAEHQPRARLASNNEADVGAWI